MSKPQDTDHRWSKIFFSWLLTICVFFSAPSFAEDASAQLGQGFLDAITVHDTQIKAQGWAAQNNTHPRLVSIQIKFGDKIAYNGPVETFERPDVVQHSGKQDWLRSGWKVTFARTTAVDYDLPISAQARFDDGELLLLTVPKQTSNLPSATKDITSAQSPSLILIIIALAALFLVTSFLKTAVLRSWIQHSFNVDITEPMIFSGCVLLVAMVFTGLGLTGSSIGLGLGSTPFLHADNYSIQGSDQPVRSDEWAVVTPLAIAQYNHQPANPVINRNVGEEGQNMLIIGMTGVPVAHLSAIAKPATWGFFLFDLKTALSWNWLFPVFSCFLTLGFVLNTLSPGYWRRAFLLSGVFSCSPYVVAWSNWPAYTVFFPCLACLCLLAILKVNNTYKQLLLGLTLGLSTAGFVFILYPPWQVSLGYVFIAITVGIVLRDGLYKAFSARRIAAIGLGIIVALVMVGIWWLDAKPAIQSMVNTVYPGQRLSTGGDVSWSFLMRGFTNIETVQQLQSPLSNQSEIASFYYWLVPLAAVFLIRAKEKALTYVEYLLALSMVFILFYMFIGIPTEVAQYSLWGRVPATRADLALGLTAIILTSVLLTDRPHGAPLNNRLPLLAVMVSMAWTFVVYLGVSKLDVSITLGINNAEKTAVLFITFATGYYLIMRQFRPFILLSLGLALATTLSFNPLNVAPNKVFNTAAKANGNMPESRRILILNGWVSSMFLLASGTPVASGTFYYPQKTPWTRLDPEATQRDIYNRYQHLYYSNMQDGISDVTVLSPSPDLVQVKINLKTFDFRKSGAHLIAAPDGEQRELSSNPVLKFLSANDGWAWFETIQ